MLDGRWGVTEAPRHRRCRRLLAETAQAVHACNASGPVWDLRGFVDDDASRTGTTVDGVPVLGTIGSLERSPTRCWWSGTGRPDNYTTKLEIVRRMALAPERFATIVHPSASLATTTTVGVGTVILAGSVATASVTIGHHVAVMPGVVLTHDNVIDDYATIASGVRLGGGVHIGMGAYIGAGVACAREHHHRAVGDGRHGLGRHPRCPGGSALVRNAGAISARCSRVE